MPTPPQRKLLLVWYNVCAISPKCERPFGHSGGPRYAPDAWARFELLGAPQGPSGERTSADDLHLNFANI